MDPVLSLLSPVSNYQAVNQGREDEKSKIPPNYTGILFLFFHLPLFLFSTSFSLFLLSLLFLSFWTERKNERKRSLQLFLLHRLVLNTEIYPSLIRSQMFDSWFESRFAAYMIYRYNNHAWFNSDSFSFLFPTVFFPFLFIFTDCLEWYMKWPPSIRWGSGDSSGHWGRVMRQQPFFNPFHLNEETVNELLLLSTRQLSCLISISDNS